MTFTSMEQNNPETVLLETGLRGILYFTINLSVNSTNPLLFPEVNSQYSTLGYNQSSDPRDFLQGPRGPFNTYVHGQRLTIVRDKVLEYDSVKYFGFV